MSDDRTEEVWFDPMVSAARGSVRGWRQIGRSLLLLHGKSVSKETCFLDHGVMKGFT